MGFLFYITVSVYEGILDIPPGIYGRPTRQKSHIHLKKTPGVNPKDFKRFLFRYDF